MDLGIRGKIAFVSGGSQGMGLATAKLLAKEGCRVAVVARNQQRIDDAVAAITAASGEAIGVSADLATQEGVDRALATVRGRFGPPEIVIAQTNDFTSGDFFDVDDEDFVRVFRTFTIAYAMLARAVIPDMQAAGWGRIVHIGSAIAKEPQRDLAHIVHNTVRPSTTSMIKTLADQFSKYGITFNSIAPGYIMTDTMLRYFTEKYGVADDSVEEWVEATRGIPCERAGQPEEIAAAVAFLCSKPAGYITGEWLLVDGGWHRSAV